MLSQRALIGEKIPEGFTQELDLSFDANKMVFGPEYMKAHKPMTPVAEKQFKEGEKHH